MKLKLDDQQLAAVDGLRGPHANVIVHGAAGTAKTTVFKEAMSQVAPNTVMFATASTGKAAQGLTHSYHTLVGAGGVLSEDLPCPAMTLARFLMCKRYKDELVALAQTGHCFSVVIGVDEFGMLTASLFNGLYYWRGLFKRFPNVVVKFWFFGDCSQLQSPGEAGIFQSTFFQELGRAVLSPPGGKEVTAVFCLTKLYRFNACEELEHIVKLLSFPDRSASGTERRLVQAYWHLKTRFVNYHTIPMPRAGAEGVTMITYTNVAADTFNNRALEAMRRTGQKTFVLYDAKGDIVQRLSIGSHVVGIQNVYDKMESGKTRMILANGESAVVDAVLGTPVEDAVVCGMVHTCALRVDRDLKICLLDPSGKETFVGAVRSIDDDGKKGKLIVPVKPKYAGTIHSFQGDTLGPDQYGKVILDVPSCTSFESFYVMLTRCRYFRQMYVVQFELQFLLDLFAQRQDSKVRSFAAMVAAHGKTL